MGQAVLAWDMIFSAKAGLLIFSLILSFSVGEHARLLPNREKYIHDINRSAFENIFEDQDFRKKLKWTVLIIGVVSIVGSLLYLFIFIRHFGSLLGLMTAGWAIREEIGTGGISVPLAIRMLFLLAYPAISLALIYWVIYGFRWFLLMPFLTILIFGAVQAARAGTFIVIIWIFIASFWKDIVKEGRISNVSLMKRIVLYPALILTIFMLGLMYREQNIGVMEDFLRYLHIFNTYTFGAISAFSAFLDLHMTSASLTWGQYSFSSLFELLGISNLVFGYYDEYLVISHLHGDATNVYTMFRSLIEDFGMAGAHIYMFLLGAIASKVHSMTMKGSLPALSFSSIFYVLLVYSPIAPLTQHTSLLFCLFVPVLMIKIIQYKFVNKNLELLFGPNR